MTTEESVAAASVAGPSATEEATETSQPARRPRKKREPVTTLEGFFSKRTIKPGSFLKDMAEAGIWQFDDADVGRVLESHKDRDRDFARTTQLMAAALKEKDGRSMYSVIGFGETAIRARLEGNPYFVGVDLDELTDPDEKLSAIARALGQRLKEPSKRAESTNLLVAAILWLHRAAGLESQSAVETLTATLTGSQTTTRDRERAKLVWLGEHPKDVRPVSEMLAPSFEVAARAASDIEAAEARATEERSARDRAEAENVRLAALIADYETRMSRLEEELTREGETATAARVHADHDVAQVKARVAGVLDSQLRDLVGTVEEALLLDPPRVKVAREKAQALSRELDRQVTWLRS